MSKFFKGAVSSSDSSDSESSDGGDAAPRVTRPTVKAFDYPSDSDEEGQKRVVKAQKDRKFDELKDLIKQSKNSKNIKDMSKLMTLQEDLAKLFEKTRPVIIREGLTMPRFYIRYLVELEDFVNEQWEDREGRKVMSKANSKGLTALRQKLRKYNKDFETDIAAYRKDSDPVGYSSAEDAVVDNDVNLSSEDDEPTAVVEKGKPKRPMRKALDEDSDSDWDSEGESSESELSDIEGKQMEDLRKFFLKKEFKKDEKDTQRKRREPKKQKPGKDRPSEDEQDDAGDEDWQKVLTKEDKERQLFAPNAEINHEAVIKKLSEIIAARGRKSTNRKHHVRSLQELLRYSDEANLGAGLSVKILFAIISGLFELNVKINDFMDFSTWHKTLDAISGLIELLTESPTVSLTDRITEDDEDLINPKEYRVHGSILLAVERLDTEFTKILQNADCHSTDYIDKLKGEKDLCGLIERVQTYIESRSDVFNDEDFCKIYILRIEHLYYKYETEEERAAAKETSTAVMDRLCKAVYARDQGKRLRQRAMLCHIYHNALHDRWHQARDLMLMSHLQATVDHSDVSTQILYNRAICQLGLCAFRHGHIKEAHQGLSEIQNTQRSKELLAQGLAMRQQDRTAEQEKQERARQIPYHMHINVELMECVYLICSMLLEIPQMASREYEMRRRMLSRSFHYQLKQSEKSSLIGPPENTREHVVAASRAMLAGDWEKCRDYIVNEKMNTKVWNLFRNSEQVKAMVVRRIQEESLRTYLLTYSTVYTTVSLDTLADLFELEKKAVHALMSKMIIQEELLATLDAPTDCLIMHREEPSRLQLLGLQMTEKLSALADNNDQIIEPRTGRGGYTGPGNWYGRQDRGDDKQRQGGRGGGGYQGGRGGGGYQGGRGGGGYQGGRGGGGYQGGRGGGGYQGGRGGGGYQGGRGGGGYQGGGGGYQGGGGGFGNRRPWENQNNRDQY